MTASSKLHIHTRRAGSAARQSVGPMSMLRVRPVGMLRLQQARLRPLPRLQAGVAMIEAMIAIVIFSIGILGIVAMQARSSQILSDSVFRAQAAQLASELLAEMWTSDPSTRVLQYASASNGARYIQWRTRFETGASMLPGSAANPPVVQVVTNQAAMPTVPVSFQTASDVTITIFWQRPGGAMSQYVTTARILEPQS